MQISLRVATTSVSKSLNTFNGVWLGWDKNITTHYSSLSPVLLILQRGYKTKRKSKSALIAPEKGNLNQIKINNFEHNHDAILWVENT